MRTKQENKNYKLYKKKKNKNRLQQQQKQVARRNEQQQQQHEQANKQTETTLKPMSMSMATHFVGAFKESNFSAEVLSSSSYSSGWPNAYRPACKNVNTGQKRVQDVIVYCPISKPRTCAASELCMKEAVA